MERVALAYGGTLVRQGCGLLMTSFATANAATLAACEMQRRCHGMLWTANHPVALHVGIHRATAPRTHSADPDERRDERRRFGFATAQLLADATGQIRESRPRSGVTRRAI